MITTSSTAQIRHKLNMAFDEPQLSAFCLDNYPGLYDRFSQGMLKDEKISHLLDHCRRQATGFQILLDHVRQESRLKAPSGNTSNLPDKQLKPLIDELSRYISSRQIADTTKENMANEPQFPIFRILFGRNRNFTGREDILAKMDHHLNSGDGSIPLQALTGLGGVGKSQIAIEYAHRHRDEYDLIWWVRAESEATMLADYQELVNQLNLAIKTSAEQTVFVNVVRSWLRSTPQKWLLIFDNAEEAKQVEQFLPLSGKGKILITSRDPNWQHLAEVCPITPFSIDGGKEAQHFLLARTGSQDEATADSLARLLGGLPLALEQAAAFINKGGTPLAIYLILYQKQRKELWQQEEAPQGYMATLTTTWELAFQQIKQSVPAAIALLNLCAFFVPDDIPLSILREGSASLPSDLAKAVNNPLELENTIAALYQYSLIGRNGESLTVHRLVQDVARYRLGEERAQKWAEIALNLMIQLFPFDRYNLDTWLASAKLLKNVLTVLDHAKKCDLAPTAVAALYQKTGEYLSEQGEYSRAQDAIEQVLAIRKRIFGEEALATAESLDYLGQLNQEQAHYTEAKRYYEEALRIRQAHLGEKHEAIATSLHNLGYFLSSQGEYKVARPYCERALAIMEETIGANHPDTASILNNHALLLKFQGEYKVAHLYYERALIITQEVLGANHPHTANTLNNIAELLKSQGEYEAALSYSKRALAIREEILGAHHPHTANSLNSIAESLKSQGEYKAARPYYEQALTITEEVRGPNHPDTARSLNNLAGLLSSQGEYKAAHTYFERSLTITEELLGANHPHRAKTLNNFAELLRAEGKYEAARIYYEQALAIHREVLGDHHLDTALSLNNLGRLLYEQGKYVEAKRNLTEALSIYKSVHRKEHPDLVTILSNLARLMANLGEFTLARRYMTWALQICQQTNEQYPECEEVFRAAKLLQGGIIGQGKGKKKPKKKTKKKPKKKSKKKGGKRKGGKK